MCIRDRFTLDNLHFQYSCVLFQLQLYYIDIACVLFHGIIIIIWNNPTPLIICHIICINHVYYSMSTFRMCNIPQKLPSCVIVRPPLQKAKINRVFSNLLVTPQNSWELLHSFFFQKPLILAFEANIAPASLNCTFFRIFKHTVKGSIF